MTRFKENGVVRAASTVTRVPSFLAMPPLARCLQGRIEPI
jgi:hypothetical protein